MGWAGLVLVTAGLVGLWWDWRRRRRARNFARLLHAVKMLGFALGGRGDSTIETVEDGHLVLVLDGERARLPILDVIDIAEGPPERVLERLRWLVSSRAGRPE